MPFVTQNAYLLQVVARRNQRQFEINQITEGLQQLIAMNGNQETDDAGGIGGDGGGLA